MKLLTQSLARIAFSIVILSLTFVQAAPTSVSAAPVYTYRWQFIHDFETGTNGRLIFDVLQSGLLVESYTVQVPCTEVGNVDFIDGVAVFSGGGYLSCRLDIQAAAAQAILKYGISVPNEDTYGGMDFSADVYLAPIAGIEQPLFYHEDLGYTLNVLGEPGETPVRIRQAVRMSTFDPASFLPVEVAQMSSFFSIEPSVATWQTYESEYTCSAPGIATCQIFFQAMGAVDHHPNVGTEVQFTTSGRRLYIGYDPVSGVRLRGRLDRVEIDPGNFAK